MFSDNKKISGRQAFRLLTYDFLGLSTLLVPTVLGRLAGRDGIFCILLGLLASLLYLGLLGAIVRDMDVEYPVYLEQSLGIFWGKLIQAGYLVFFVLLAGYTAYLFSGLVLKNLLREESYFLVLALILLLAAYGLWGGIEGRARVYEILFWFIMIPLFLMLLSTVDEIRTDYWAPVFSANPVDAASGTYYVFQCFSLIFLILFLQDFMEKKEALLLAGKKALVFTGCVHAVLYLILVGFFGAAALGKMDFAAVTLMSAVHISDGFLKRTDAFMFGIWFFTLYALLWSTVFYGGGILFRLVGGEKLCRRRMPGRTARAGGSVRTMESAQARAAGERLSTFIFLAVVFVLAGLFYGSQTACHWYGSFLWYGGTPFLVAVPLVLAARIALIRRFGEKGKKGKSAPASQTEGKIENRAAQLMPAAWGKPSGSRKKRRNRLVLLAGILTSAMLLSSCKTAELEDRNFPLEIAVDGTGSFAEEWLNAAEAGNRVIDYSHLKAIIISQDFLEDGDGMEELLDMMEEKSDIPRNTYVVAAEDAGSIMGLSGNLGESIGSYLEELLENVSEVDKKVFPTLGMLYQEQENRLETLFLPYFVKEDGKPVLKYYYAWKRGEAAGVMDSKTALLSFFTGNKTDSYTLVMDGAAVKLFSPHNEISFSDGKQREIAVWVHCTGEILYKRGQQGEAVLERQIEEYMNDVAAAALVERQIDITDSYRKLGGYMREWYAQYALDAKSYEPDMRIVYSVEIKWDTV